MIINDIKRKSYERIVRFQDDDFDAIIAIHNTVLGPALGGCRVIKYNNHQDMLTDAMRLSRGMTYKNSLAGLQYGGGKMVVNATYPTPTLMTRVGEAINYMEGMYISAEDVGVNQDDMNIAAHTTPYVATRATNTSMFTAYGVFNCMMVAIKHSNFMSNHGNFMSKNGNLNGLKNFNVWVQGLGKVGYELVRMLRLPHENNIFDMMIYVSDIDENKVEKVCSEFNVLKYYDTEWNKIDFYAPCALGQVVTPDNIHKFEDMIICGSANNQLMNIKLAAQLANQQVVYVPDFLANAGGVINVADSLRADYNHVAVGAKIDELGVRLQKMLSFYGPDDRTVNVLAKVNKMVQRDLKQQLYLKSN